MSLVNRALKDLHSIDEPVRSKIEEDFRTIERWPSCGTDFGNGRRYFSQPPFVIIYSVTNSGDIVVESIVREHSNWR